MAVNIPPGLKSIDITRFAIRAAQTETAVPALSYWCNYWIVSQIIASRLHKADDGSKAYVFQLMDKLEKTKSEHPDNPAINDENSGKAFVEHFGLDTFLRAGNAMKANRTTRQTADTFQAAATFLDLLQIWGPLRADISSKVKFAKYHALRIAKALKAGEDPNLSNPTPELSPTAEAPPLDPNDPEVRQLLGNELIPPISTTRQPSVEDVPDEHDRLQSRMARVSSLDQSLHPSRAPSLPRPAEQHPPVSPVKDNGVENFYNTSAPDDVSPLAPSVGNDRRGSAGGGYFPAVPSSSALNSTRDLPSPPPIDTKQSLGYSKVPDFPSAATRAPDPPSIPPPGKHNLIQPPPVSPPPFTSYNHPFPQQSVTSAAQGFVPPNPPSFLPSDPHQPTYSQPPPAAAPRPEALQMFPNSAYVFKDPSQYITDEDSIAKAQKHAKWAISALNFEDVPTAVKELRGALETLGAL